MEYHPNFANQEEEEVRKEYFMENLELIESIQEEKHEFTLTENEFADYSIEELKSTKLGINLEIDSNLLQ